MQPANDNDSHAASFSESDYERDPMRRCRYYPKAEMWVTFDGRPAQGVPFVFSNAKTPSVAQALASVVELCLLDLAETDFCGELTFRVHLQSSVKSPWFIYWEREHGSLD